MMVEAIRSENSTASSEPSLSSRFEGFRLTLVQKRAISILDQDVGLTFDEKKAMFFYFLWHESRSFAPIKTFEDIREDLSAVVDRVINDDRLVEHYDSFYSRYQRESVADLLKKGHRIKDVSEELEVGRSQVERVKGMLIFEGKIQPNPGRRKETEAFREFCLRVERMRNERPDMKREEMARALSCSIARLEEAVDVLIISKRITKITKDQRRTEQGVRDEDLIVKLRLEKPEMSQAQISRYMGIPKHRVAYLISNAIKTNRIPRKRALPGK